MVRVLALDPSTRCGWAVDGADHRTGPPLHGVWRLPSLLGETVDESNSLLFDLVTAALAEHRVELLVFEAPLPPGAAKWKRNPVTDRALQAQGLIIGLAGYRAKVRMREFATSTMRKHFLGSARMPDPKRAMLDRCRLLGWPTEDHNAADAMGLWSLAKSLYQPAWSPRGTPLFAKEEAR